MGMIQAEQMIAVVEATKSEPNYWWMLVLAIVPVVVAFLLNKKRK